MKKLALLGGTVGLGIVAVLGLHHHSQAADHADGPSLVPIPGTQPGNPMADLNDVFVWMTTDAAKVNLALTVSPFDNLVPAAAARHFGPTVLYAFHVTSRPGFGMPGMESKIVCKFADDTHGECWVIDPTNKVIDYVGGDLSGPNGRISDSKKFRVFAGKRSDPFFFNLGGTRKAVTTAEALCGGGSPGRCPPGSPGGTFQDAAGCFKADGNQAKLLRDDISTPLAADRADTPCDDSADPDCFIDANVMAIVVQIDKDELLLGTDKQLSVWASTHAGS